MYIHVHIVAVLRLTFPVREGVLLKPFQLEHGKQLSHQPFHLRESVYRMLLHRYMHVYTVLVKKTQQKYRYRTVLPMKGNGTSDSTEEYFKSTVRYLVKVFEGTSAYHEGISAVRRK